MRRPAPQPAVWQDGALRSALYGDIYYSAEDGLAETRAVFLDGCGLPAAWRGRARFTVAELGFGTGLNIAALLDLWSRHGSGGILHIFSIEAHPLPREDAARALANWPDLGEAARALLERWPGARRGFHRLEFPRFRAVLDLAVMEAAPALSEWQGRADAWFLDGFSPASNPAMWREEVLDLIAARSAPGARAATFTVAGAVRRGLAARGFSVERRPGFGRKKERLEARLPGFATELPFPTRIAVIGAGIAGASLARAFRALGCEAQIISQGEDDAASGNPAALVTPGLDASGGPRAAFYATAFARAADLYAGLPDAVIATGALNLETESRDARRFEAVAAQDLFEPGALRILDPRQAADWLDEAPGAGGLFFERGLTIDPLAVRNAWLAGAVCEARIVALEQDAGGWTLRSEEGETFRADAVVIASGWGVNAFLPDLALKPIRGQASWTKLAEPPRAASFAGYAVPTREGVVFGATFDRGDIGVEARDDDHARNLALLRSVRPGLATRIRTQDLKGRAAIRAVTPDQFPLAGAVGPGLFVLAGLGSRGFTTAPLMAEHVAAQVLGAPSPLPAHLAALVEPLRF